jgi:prevent-host-death family protein
MRRVALSEVKDHLSEYVAAVQDGQEVIITRHGKPAAKLVSLDDQSDRQTRARKAIETLAGIRATMRAEGRTSTIEEMIAWKNEGQR